jgi:hypothetical protein
MANVGEDAVTSRGDDTRLTPVLVDGSGRGGTTLAMQILGTSPQVALDRVPPYERRYFNYLLEWSRVLERPARSSELWPGNATESLPRDHGMVGPIPWSDRSLIVGSVDDLSMSQRCFQLVWHEFSLRAAASVRARFEEASVQVLYFAEKARATWRLLELDYLKPLKVLPLMRDPRDAWVSEVAFNKSKARGFGELRNESEQDVLPRFVRRHKQRLRWGAGLLKAGETPVFRYEDLILDLPAECARLERYLGVQLNPQDVIRRRDEHRKHMTADSPEASVGRWRRELGIEIAELLTQELGPELRLLGYDSD